MATHPPKLFLHTTGQWCCKWRGRFRYFGQDKNLAEPQYLQSISEWAKWRQEKAARRSAEGRILIMDLVERFLEHKEAAGGQRRRAYYANHLNRLIHAFANTPACEFRAKHLQAMIDGMTKARMLAPKTIVHDVSCIRSLFLYGSGMELVAPVDLRFAKAPPLPPTRKKALSRRQLKAMLAKATEDVKPWLSVQYLTAMRPSEVCRVVFRQGTWERPWLFRCNGKSTWRSQEDRRIVFSDDALFWLRKCGQHWRHPSSYYHATAECCGHGGPHPLRHTAATHLAEAGVPRADIDLILGHLPPRVSTTYSPVSWQSLRPLVARLRLPI